MNLNRETLKKLIQESLEELTQQKNVPNPESAKKGGIEKASLERIEDEVREELLSFVTGRGKSMVRKVARASATLAGRARMLTIIADAFGIKAKEVKSNISKASDDLSKPSGTPDAKV